MRRGMDKALAAFACALLIGALGALSWHSDQEMCAPAQNLGPSFDDADARDEVIFEIEKLHSIWRNNDAGTGSGKGEAGNP